MSQPVLVEKERGRARIILNRPDRHNAVSGAMSRQIADALWDADGDDAIHAVVIKGNGAINITSDASATAAMTTETSREEQGSVPGKKSAAFAASPHFRFQFMLITGHSCYAGVSGSRSQVR